MCLTQIHTHTQHEQNENCTSYALTTLHAAAKRAKLKKFGQLTKTQQYLFGCRCLFRSTYQLQTSYYQLLLRNSNSQVCAQFRL